VRREPHASEVSEVDDETVAIPVAEPDTGRQPDLTSRPVAERPPEATLDPEAAQQPAVPPEADRQPEPEAKAPPEQPPEPEVERQPEPELAAPPRPEPAPPPGPPRGQVPAKLFAAITVVPAMLAAAWLLPGFPLLLAGRFFAPPMVFMFAPLAVGLCYFALRQLPATWPGFRSGPAGAPQPARKPVPWWTVAATVAVAAAFAAWQIAEHTQQIIFLRDPATYLQVGYWIAHHGSLPITDSPDAFGAGPHTGLSFASVNYYPRGSGIVPQFMTGMPIVVAAAIWLGEVPAALVITPLIGACAVLSFAGLAGRLIGARWAPAAAAVLALSLPEIYTSRSTFSEPLAQVLLFGGLCLLTDALVVNRTKRAARAEHDNRAEHGEHDEHAEHRTRRTDWPGQDAVLAGLAGLALGLTVLVRLDALSDILPAVPFLGLLLAARRQRRLALPFALGLLIGVGYGLADGYLKSRPYLDLEAPSLRPLALITAAVALLTVAFLIIARIRPAATRLRRWLTPRVLRWLPAAAAAVTVLIFVGFAIRPLVQTVTGETDPTSIAYVAELQKLAHLPINGRRQYYEQSLYWVIWYIGVPAVLLGAFGLALLARRGTRALLTWRDPDGDARVWALPLLIAIWVIASVLWRPAVAPDQPWASRRLVPFVLPGLILGGIWACAWLKERAGLFGRAKGTAAAVATFCVASMVIPTVLTTFDVTSTGVHGMAFRRIGGGEQTAVRNLCAAIGQNSAVLILDSLTADRFAQLVRGMCDTPTATLTTVTPATVQAAVAGIQGTGRTPVLLAETEAELTPYGGAPREVVNLLTTQEAHELTSPPTRTWLIRYTVWMSTPAALPG
jgi:hypothetical protein